MSAEASLLSLGESTAEAVERALQNVYPGAVRAGLREVDVDLRAEVGETRLALDDVLALRPGDVIKFDAMAGDDTAVYADGVPVHRARAGRSGSRRAIQILGPFGEEAR